VKSILFDHVLLIVIFLQTGLALLSPQEKHHSRTGTDRSLAYKVFVTQFMNTAIVAMLVNTKIPGFAERFALGFPIFAGNYKDFTLDW
jgi:hypothetical protein